MITTQQIYDATEKGLKIIKYFYPQAEIGKAFSIRADEKTPSSHIKEIKGVWRLTDFGESDESKTPIDIIMSELNIKVGEAIYWAAREFGVVGDDVIVKEKNVAKIERREATDDEQEGQFIFKAKPFTEYELRLLGPKVDESHCENLNWVSLEYYRRTKKDKNTDKLMTTTISSTEFYPIFMRKCIYTDITGKLQHFHKIYQPLNAEKQYRFFYEGYKPQQYINGLHELKAFHAEFNADAEERFHNNPANSEKVFKPTKLPEAFICSGERDALCLEALKYPPLWFNSETYNLSDYEYYEISKYVERIYNIPDIDETGIRKGKELANKFIEIYTVWLPKKLREYNDNRQRPRKDLRDYVEIWKEKKDFDNIVRMAMPVQFWETKLVKGEKRLEINTEFLFNFLAMNGFYCLEDKSTKTGIVFIQIKDNVVYKTNAKKVQSFIKKFAQDRYLDIDIRNLIHNSTRISENQLMGLAEIELSFIDFTPESQTFYFQNAAFVVKADAIEEYSLKKMSEYVWEEEVIPHTVKRLEPSFKITNNEFGEWDIVTNHLDSNFFKFIINTSRIHWRKEFETQFADNLNTSEAIEYREKYHFDISGPYLSEEETEEQRDHLINKIFALGYLLHRHKSNHRAWCVFAMDNKISDGEDCNGGSGKSVCLKLIQKLMKSKYIPGGNPKVIENPHIYEGVTEHTDYMLVDDADKYLPFRFFFDTVTGDMVVNPKHGTIYTIPFENVPKIAISSNYTLDRFDASTERRILYMVFSDYYHEKTDSNGYHETRTIFDDFQKDLFRNKYSEEEWNADLNFLMDCTQFYLSTIDLSVKIQPPMGNVKARNLRAVMTDVFFDWAQVYFYEDSENCNNCISRDKALQDFGNSTGQKKWTMNKFSKAIKAFCNLTEYVLCLNPVELQNAQGRIIRKVDGKSTEMLYIQTKKAINILDSDLKKQPTIETLETQPNIGKDGKPFPF